MRREQTSFRRHGPGAGTSSICSSRLLGWIILGCFAYLLLSPVKPPSFGKRKGGEEDAISSSSLGGLGSEIQSLFSGTASLLSLPFIKSYDFSTQTGQLAPTSVTLPSSALRLLHFNKKRLGFPPQEEEESNSHPPSVRALAVATAWGVARDDVPSSASGSLSPPRPVRILILGIGEMLGSSIARAALRVAGDGSRRRSGENNNKKDYNNIEVIGADDFSRGFVTLIPPMQSAGEMEETGTYESEAGKTADSSSSSKTTTNTAGRSTVDKTILQGAVFVEVGWGYGDAEYASMRRLMDVIGPDGLESIDAVFLGMDDITTGSATAAISMLIRVEAERARKKHKIDNDQGTDNAEGAAAAATQSSSSPAPSLPRAPVFVVPDTFARPHGVQSRQPTNGRTAADAMTAADEARTLFLEEIDRALHIHHQPQQQQQQQGSRCTASGGVCMASSVIYEESGNVPRHQATLVFADIGTAPAMGPGLQLSSSFGRSSSSSSKETQIHEQQGEAERIVNEHPLFGTVACLEAAAQRAIPAETIEFKNAGDIMSAFEQSIGARIEKGFFYGQSATFQGGDCSSHMTRSLAENPVDIDAIAVGMLGAATAVGRREIRTMIEEASSSLSSHDMMKNKKQSSAIPWTEQSLIAFRMTATENDGGNLAAAGVAVSHPSYYNSIISGGRSDFRFIVPPPLWSLQQVASSSPETFTLPNTTFPILKRLAEIVQVSKEDKGEDKSRTLSLLLEACWWAFRHGALSGYREPWPSAGDFGGARVPSSSSSSSSSSTSSDVGIIGNAFMNGRKYSLRDLYFFGITHHTLHEKAAASQAAYAWRLRRGGLLWYSTQGDPILPMVPVNHPFGQHYGTLFLRVAMVWQRVHAATANAYAWYTRIWDDNYIIADAYVFAANTADAQDTIALGRIGEYRARVGAPGGGYFFKFLGGGACSLMSNALIRTQSRILSSCLLAAELWYSNADPSSAVGFDPIMPECPPGRYGCEDVAFSYCLRKELGEDKYKIIAAPGFNHVDADTLNPKGLFDCRGLACRRKTKSEDNYGAFQRTVVLHWVRSGKAMLRYDDALYGQVEGVKSGGGSSTSSSSSSRGVGSGNSHGNTGGGLQAQGPLQGGAEYCDINEVETSCAEEFEAD